MDTTDFVYVVRGLHGSNFDPLALCYSSLAITIWKSSDGRFSIEQAGGIVRDRMAAYYEISITPYWSNGPRDAPQQLAAYALQQRYSNSEKSFYRELFAAWDRRIRGVYSRRWKEVEADKLFSAIVGLLIEYNLNPQVIRWNPKCSSTVIENLKHAWRYAIGEKMFADRSRTYPNYDRDGQPHNPQLGLILLFRIPRTHLDGRHVHDVCKMHARNEIRVGYRILPEQELAWDGFLNPEYLVDTFTISSPRLTPEQRRQRSAIRISRIDAIGNENPSERDAKALVYLESRVVEDQYATLVELIKTRIKNDQLWLQLPFNFE
eukprot:TRINITY_DN11867_c0_g1_i1.p1 TRINITY_DN11867_c0_g1~~TRINITY_DN11867_c0_g1_i1.p1  ORF type:complete len:320 (-),score=45.18 TRINITY_DN11867_c0_g1_i1:37-996(-)